MKRIAAVLTIALALLASPAPRAHADLCLACMAPVMPHGSQWVGPAHPAELVWH